jgi:hypothetical protein
MEAEMTTDVLLRGNKVVMDVDVSDFHEKMLVQPGVYITDIEMGISVCLFEESKPQKPVTVLTWGLSSPQDLLTCWRGMLILQEIKTLEKSDLSNAYYAGQRNPNENEKHRVVKIAAKIGQDVYDEIKAHPVPDEVVNLIIKLTDEGKPLALWPITDEVRAGTLKWCEDFVRIGVKHPNQIDNREVMEKRVIARYESHLQDYAKTLGCSRDSLMMGCIESGIIDAVEKGVESTQGQDLVLGIAIAQARGGSAAFASFLGFGCDDNFIKQEVQRGTEEAARWLINRFTKGWNRKPIRSESEYKVAISLLDDNWQNMPITHPLSA